MLIVAVFVAFLSNNAFILKFCPLDNPVREAVNRNVEYNSLQPLVVFPKDCMFSPFDVTHELRGPEGLERKRFRI